jgi:putative transposase
VISLTERGLTTGEISAHLADVYGAEVSRDTISRITDAVVEELAGWQSRPLAPVYPVVFIDAIHVKIRDGQGL